MPDGVELWLVESMNPDGQAAQDRHNANQVDLNRNFPYKWEPLGVPGDGQYAGTGPASEPETQAMVNFIAQLRPDIAIWYHQDLNVISPGEGRDGRIRADTPSSPDCRWAASPAARTPASRPRGRATSSPPTIRGVHRRARRDAVARGGDDARRGRAHDRRRGLTPRSIRRRSAPSRKPITAPPPSRLRANTVPPWRSATSRTIDRSQPRPRHRPRLVGAMEAFEHERQLVLGNAGAAIGDGDTAVAHADLDRGARRIELGGVVEQARQRALHRRPLGDDERGLGDDHDVAPAAALVAGGDVSRQLGEVERLPGLVDDVADRHGDDLVDQLGELFDLGVDVLDHGLAVGGRQVGVAILTSDRGEATRLGAQAARIPEQLVSDLLSLEHSSNFAAVDSARLFPQYLAAVEHLAHAVDTWRA